MPGPGLVSRDAVMSTAAVLWPLGVELGSRADLMLVAAWMHICPYVNLPRAFKGG